MLHYHRLATWLLVSLSAGAAGCFGCNLMWAPSMVDIVVDGADWPAGTYEIEVQGYNQFGMCVITLPGVAEDAFCTDNAELELNEAGDAITGLRVVSFAPEGFSIALDRDHELVAEAFVTPEYAVDEPNGRNCGERRLASATLAL